MDSGYCGAQEGGANLIWTLTSDGALTIGGEGSMADYSGYAQGNNVFVSTAPWSAHMSDIRSLIVSSGVTGIGRYAFFGCRALSSVTLPEGLTDIRGCAFFGVGITELTLPQTAVNLGEQAFYYCRALTEVTLPENITQIAQEAFACCTALPEITLPHSVTQIGFHAFYYCDSLRNVYYDGTREEWDAVSFPGGFTQDSFFSPVIRFTDGTHICGAAEVTYENQVSSTCSAAGGCDEVYYCAECGAELRRERRDYEIADHTWGAWEILTAPTADREGLMRRVCREEASHIETAAIPAGAFGAHEILKGYCGGEGDGRNLQWSLSDDGVLTVTGSGRMADYGTFWPLTADHHNDYSDVHGYTRNSPAPWKQETLYEDEVYAELGLDITDDESMIMAVANGDLTYAAYMEAVEALEETEPHTVTLGEGLTYIGANAFNGWSVAQVSLPSTLEEIGYNSLACMTGDSVTLPEGLRFIDPSAFQECRFESIVIPASVEKIGENAFSANPYGADVRILKNITVLNPDANISDIFGGISVLCAQGSAFPLREWEDYKDLNRFDNMVVDYYFLHEMDRLDDGDLEALRQMGLNDEQIARYIAFLEDSLVYEANIVYGFGAVTREDAIERLCLLVNEFLGVSLSEADLFVIDEQDTPNCYSRGEVLLAPAAEAAFETRFGGGFLSLIRRTYEPRPIASLLTDASYTPIPGATVYGPCFSMWAEEIGEALRVESILHDPVNGRAIKEPTCTAPGQIEYHCSICDNAVYEEIPALGHGSQGYNVTSAPSTCTVRGYKMTVCIACGEVTAYDVYDIDPNNHRWGEWEVIRQATETEEGLMRRVCENDPAHVEERVIPMYEEDENGNPTQKIQEFIERIETYVKGVIDWILRLFNFFGKR